MPFSLTNHSFLWILYKLKYLFSRGPPNPSDNDRRKHPWRWITTRPSTCRRPISPCVRACPSAVSYTHLQILFPRQRIVVPVHDHLAAAHIVRRRRAQPGEPCPVSYTHLNSLSGLAMASRVTFSPLFCRYCKNSMAWSRSSCAWMVYQFAKPSSP